MDDGAVLAGVQEVVDQYAGIPAGGAAIGPETDLYAAGMTSFASVEVMLGLEERFGITFPQNLIQRETFLTMSAMATAVTKIRDQS